MICPACFSQMIKVRRRPTDSYRGRIRCIHCSFTLVYKEPREPEGDQAARRPSG